MIVFRWDKRFTEPKQSPSALETVLICRSQALLVRCAPSRSISFLPISRFGVLNFLKWDRTWLGNLAKWEEEQSSCWSIDKNQSRYHHRRQNHRNANNLNWREVSGQDNRQIDQWPSNEQRHSKPPWIKPEPEDQEAHSCNKMVLPRCTPSGDLSSKRHGRVNWRLEYVHAWGLKFRNSRG